MTIRSSLSLAILLAGAACGGGGGQRAAEPTPPDERGGDAPSRPDPGEAMVPPDAMDEIQRRFDRKRPAVSRCLSAAIDAKELPGRARGRITLNVVIMPGGKAGEVTVARATLESPRLTECVIGKVREIGFPELPRPFPTSYTYAFEAM